MVCIYKCLLYPKEYKTEQLVISHLKIDHFIKNYTVEMKCVIKGNTCERGFYKYDLLKNHLKKCPHKNSKNEKFDVVPNSSEKNLHIDIQSASELIEKKLVITQSVDQNRDNYFSLESIPSNEISHSASLDNNGFILKNEETNDFCENSMDNFLDFFIRKISNLTLTHEQTTIIYNLCSELVVNASKLNEHLIKGNNGFGKSLVCCSTRTSTWLT